METIILVVVIGLMDIFCFITGARVGQKVVRQEPVEMPNLNPVKAIDKVITEHRVTKEKEAEEEYFKALMHNIDNYDGTSVGQVNIPARK